MNHKTTFIFLMNNHKNLCALAVTMIVGAECCVPLCAQQRMSLQALFVLALAYVCFLLSLAVEVLPQIQLPHRILCDGDGVLFDRSSVI